MAKKKLLTDVPDSVEDFVIDAVKEPEDTELRPMSEVTEPVTVDKAAPVVKKVPKDEPKPVQHKPASVPSNPVLVKKKRIRIRKKVAKKLSAAIICQNPNITRFI